MKTIKFAIEHHILIITIDREASLNALNDSMINEIGRILTKHKEDSNVYGVVITGSGDKAFAAGADIKNFPMLNADQGMALSRSGHAVFNAVETYPKPVIAAINGYALGGGLELAMACHLRIASENAAFGMPEVKLGLVPGYGGTQRLSRLIGKAKAMEYILTAEMMDASEAHRLGLVNKIVVGDLLMTAAVELIKKISKRGPLAISIAIKLVNASVDSNVDGFEEEIKSFGVLMNSSECKEGVAAFIEKRKPDFRGASKSK